MKAVPSALLGLLWLSACAGEGGTADGGEDSGTAPEALGFADTDGDSILDVHETDADQDADGQPNLEDLDSDGDGVSDAVEAGDSLDETLPFDTDLDGLADFLDLDSDGNCFPDQVEAPGDQDPPLDSDADGSWDFVDLDDDGDGMLDTAEGSPVEDCAPFDFDNDGQQDRLDLDSDNDGILDADEAGGAGEAADTDGDGIIDSRDLDSDADGVPDVTEGSGESDGGVADTDGDGIADQRDVDADGDGLEDGLELGLHGTDPSQADTDGDGIPDGGEIYIGTDPLDEASTLDGIYMEISPRTAQELEFEVALEIQKADIAFLLDTTATMVEEAGALRAAFSSIVDRLALTIPNIAFGFAQTEDYWDVSTGTSTTGALPFRMRQQITTSTDMMNEVLGSVEHHAGGIGGDYPESIIEGIFQTLSGQGHDMECDTVFDPEKDVQPFDSDPEDPFGGIGGENEIESTPGTGVLGGMGFREHALPVVIYASDDLFKDADHAEDYVLPYGCPGDAGLSDVVDAASELGAYLIGVNSSEADIPRPQMEELAVATGSMGDTNGDGVVAEPLVFDWRTNEDDATELLAGAIEELVDSLDFDELTVEVDDPQHYVVDIEPDVVDVSNLDEETETVTFHLEVLGIEARSEADQYYAITVAALGDGTLYVDEVTVLLRILRP